MDIKKIGKFIAVNRKAKGLTQEQLGEMLGVSNKTVSRWENGNYMPDLSLLEPLSSALGITLNELLAGEFIPQEDMAARTERNLVDTIGYTAGKLKHEHRKISLLIMSAGILIILFAFICCKAESSWTAVYSIIGAFLLIFGLLNTLNLKTFQKKLMLAIGLFVCLLVVFFAIDYAGVITCKRPPIYRYKTEAVLSETELIVYHNPFYRVFRINANTPNEYYMIDHRKEYTLETVPVSPFNREKSGIDHIVKYKNAYVGNNSNDGMLIAALPLSEYGYVFEIDSINAGLTIDYHFTDWYGNENLYIEKSLIYNSVSIFGLIDNVQYIQYHFSGSSYRVTRNDIENHYPEYHQVFAENQVNKENFNQYVEAKMNDRLFIKSVFAIFKS